MTIRRSLRLGGAWTPRRLGSSLVAWWDAERSDLITQSGGLVSAWRDVIGGYSMAQSSASLKPVYSSTSFNGRPGLTFDGIDDLLAQNGYPASWPSGSDPSWLWGVVDQQRSNAVPGTGTIHQYGSSSTTANTRRSSRFVISGENRGGAGVGVSGTSDQHNANVVFLGRHVLCSKITGTTLQASVDGVAGALSAATVNTTAAERTAIGGASNGGNFWLGVINTVLLTLPLSAADEASLTAHLMRRV